MMRIVLALAIFLAPAVVHAGGCAPVYYQPYYTPSYNVEVKKYTVLEFVQPYFVGIAAPYVAPAPLTSPCDEKIASLKAELAEMRKMLQAPEPPRLPQKEQQEVPRGKSVYSARCAGCHDASAAKAKGGGTILFQNDVALPLPAEIAEKCVHEMKADHMPKNGKLSAKDFMAVLCEIQELAR